MSGIVKIGQTMTMVIGVKDDENKFDMMVSSLKYRRSLKDLKINIKPRNFYLFVADNKV